MLQVIPHSRFTLTFVTLTAPGSYLSHTYIPQRFKSYIPQSNLVIPAFAAVALAVGVAVDVSIVLTVAFVAVVVCDVCRRCL